ncbi:hypothetical protein D3C81_2291190 [compost metagenome]
MPHGSLIEFMGSLGCVIFRMKGLIGNGLVQIPIADGIDPPVIQNVRLSHFQFA